MTERRAAPVLITGMHRSGTSLVAAMLARAGLHVGDEEDFLPATAYNPQGCWEHQVFVALNDEVLGALDASWDCPPPEGWPPPADLEEVRRRARRASARFARQAPVTGWKDPRTSLLLPFWRDVAGEVKVVVCIRHPRGVAASLQRWGVSPLRSAQLWRAYNERVLATTDASERLVVHYDRLLEEPVAAVARVSAFLGLQPRPGADVAAVVSAGSPPDPWRSEHVPVELYEPYRQLTGEAGLEPATPRSTVRLGALAVGRREELAARAVVRSGASSNGSGGRSPDGGPPEVSAAPWPAPADAALREVAAAVERLEAAVREQGETLARLIEGVYVAVADDRPSGVARGAAEEGYGALVRRVQDLVCRTVPIGATVSVISRGDPELVRLFGRVGWHFPRQPDGRYAGYHPKNGTAAAVHLEAQRALGAEYLVVPAPSRWWLETYRDFERHLAARYRQVADDEAGRVYSLVDPPEDDGGVATLVDLLEELAGAGCLEPSVLDLTGDGRVAETLGDHDVLVPPSPSLPLPYVDGSFDVVAVPADAPTLVEEGRRLASAALVTLGAGGAATLVPAQAPLPAVSMVVPAWNGSRLTDAFLASLRATLPPRFRGEVIVVDDASSDGTPAVLERWRRDWPELRVLTNAENRGYLGSLLRGVEAADGEYYLFLNNDMVLLRGWLEPLLRTFADFADAGAVGGRLVYPDGILQEAGGILFADGSAAKYGYGDPDLDHPAYRHVRRVDYCSGCLLLTPRAVFEEVGGLDRDFDPGYYEDTDYCLRVRLSGRAVYYQPAATVVHLEGGTAGIDPAVGMKRHQVLNQRRFVDKWGGLLARTQPARPNPADIPSLHDLVLRGAEREVARP